MTSSLGIGLALIAVAAYHLIPAILAQEIPTTRSRPLRRDERPAEFWITCSVFAAAAAIGLGMVAGALLLVITE